MGSTSVMVTAASPRALRSRVPAKITSSMRAPRRLRADCSPRTQLIASLRLDLPQPFGPTTAAMPPPLNRSSVRSQNDLKPWSSTFLSLSKLHLEQYLPDYANRHSGQSKVPCILHKVFSSDLPQHLVGRWIAGTKRRTSYTIDQN